MYHYDLHQNINHELKKHKLVITTKDNLFYTRFIANASAINSLFNELYKGHPNADECFQKLVTTIIKAYKERSALLKEKDEQKLKQGFWFLSNKITGMSLYVDRFCGNLKTLNTKLDYCKNLGVNFLHLMPIFESPAGESDGGYAVSDFRNVDKRFGAMKDLQNLQTKMNEEGMFLMIDIVLNHTSHQHEWARRAKEGDEYYQQYFYTYNDRTLPDEFEKSMPEVFPQSAPGNFTFIPEMNKWVMTVFHNYQWDLNYTNPAVFLEMLEIIFFYANLGIDILRIDAPAFIWKQMGTSCQNLPQAHTILQLIKQCTNVATPGMALLGEAIVAPEEIIKYFGTGLATAKECDFAYNATHMAVQWDALASGNTGVMLAAQHIILQKPYGTTWINYTRCHDDIGLAYNDSMIAEAGFNPYNHRDFLKNYYTGNFAGSSAAGALFSSNPKTGDARISGSLASLCGLENAVNNKDANAIELSIQKIMMMQAHSFFLGGIPMIFYGDESAHTNDYSYLEDDAKSYDNRWMHRPIIDWKKNKSTTKKGTVEEKVFSGTKKLIALRNKLEVVADHKNLTWLTSHNIHIAGYLRAYQEKKLYCVFNFHSVSAWLTWYAFKEHGIAPLQLFDHWSGKTFEVGADNEYLTLEPYGFYLFEPLA